MFILFGRAIMWPAVDGASIIFQVAFKPIVPAMLGATTVNHSTSRIVKRNIGGYS
jgi:hypothetical protein